MDYSVRIGIGITSFSLIILVLHLFFPNLNIDTIGFSLVVLAILPWLLPLLGNYLESGKIFGQEFKFLQNKVQEQSKQLEDHREIIHLIHEALKRSLTKYEFQHLVELESDKPSLCCYSDFLEKEMVRLCQHGYVSETFNSSVWKMKEKGDATFDLKDFLRITDEGKRYLDLLRELQKSVV
jgi:hypothetical protein